MTNQTVRFPLDPIEGPTAWLEIEQRPWHAEEARVTLIRGTDPDEPSTSIMLNKREALTIASEIVGVLGDD